MDEHPQNGVFHELPAGHIVSKRTQLLFARISRRYDLANDVLSCGAHRLWRKKLLDAAKLGPKQVILDLCTGTGDVALLASRKTGPQGQVLALDCTAEMLAIAQAKRSKLMSHKALSSLCAPIFFLRSDALRLPLADSSVDRVVIAFGIRNVEDPLHCLKETFRVLRPGGRLAIVEFGQLDAGFLKPCLAFYLNHLLPQIAALITGDRAAYDYLSRSSLAFPSGAAFAAMLTEAGFLRTQAASLFPGFAFLYGAERP